VEEAMMPSTPKIIKVTTAIEFADGQLLRIEVPDPYDVQVKFGPGSSTHDLVAEMLPMLPEHVYELHLTAESLSADKAITLSKYTITHVFPPEEPS
jgi:hypothetical protein